MRIVIATFSAFEEWDWRNPETQGIGGSETAQIELARRLARRGHDVTSYAPIPADCTDDPNDGHPVKWRHFKELCKDPAQLKPGVPTDKIEWNLKDPGHWIIFRQPSVGDCIPTREDTRIAQTWQLVAEDVVYFNADGTPAFTEERCARFDKIWALCPTHAQYLAEAFPFMADKIDVSSNGIEVDRIEKLFALPHDPIVGYVGDEPVEQIALGKAADDQFKAWNGLRNPMRLIWASSPDRGLEALLHIFRRAVEFEPALELHCFYGFDNWDKVIGAAQVRNGVCLNEKTRAGIAREKFHITSGETVPDDTPIDVNFVRYKYPMQYGQVASVQENMKKRITDLIESTPNVHWHGRINQPQLWLEFAQSSMWVYPTTFTETSCCTCMLAQALGAIPITNRFWAVGHNVEYGTFVDGDPMAKDGTQHMVRARFVQAILGYARDREWAEAIRAEMMPWARQRFDWENTMVQDVQRFLTEQNTPRVTRKEFLERIWPEEPSAVGAATEAPLA
jgi:glycosyltransferase involved in cell wall biosynthesis